MSDYKEIIVKEYYNEKGLVTRREIGEEIVRCEDCKYFDGFNCSMMGFPDDVVNDDSYCSFGERKDGEKE